MQWFQGLPESLSSESSQERRRVDIDKWGRIFCPEGSTPNLPKLTHACGKELPRHSLSEGSQVITKRHA